MPRITKLASQTLNVGRGSSPLSPVGFSNRATGRIRAPGVNIHAADVRNTPMPVPKIQPTTAAVALAAGASFAELTQNAAFKFQERKDIVTADDVVMEYRNELRNSIKGTMGNDGTFNKGYGSLQGQAALDGFQEHVNGVNGGFDSRVSQLSPRVQQLATVRMNQDRNSALTRATTHNAGQTAVVEEQGRYKKLNDAKANIEAYGPVSWTTGELNELFADYPSLEEQHIAAADMGTYTLYQEYNKTLSSTDDPMKAYAAAEAAMKNVRPYLGEAGEQKLDHWLLQQKSTSQTEAKKRVKEKQKEYKDQVEFEAPVTFADSMQGNTEEFIHVMIPETRKLYDTQQKSEDGVVKIMSTSFDKLNQKSGLVTVQDKIANISKHWSTLTEGEGGTTFSASELYRIDQYVNVELPGKITAQQNRQDKLSTAALATQLDEATTSGGSVGTIPAPAGMTSDNKDLWQKVQMNASRERAEGGASEGTIQNRAQAATYYGGVLTQRPLSSHELKQLDNQLYNNQVSWKTYAESIKLHNTMKNPGRAKPRYQTDAGYVTIIDTLNETFKMGGFTGTEAPKKDPETQEYQEWRGANKLAQMRAITQFDMAAKKAATNGEYFDHNEWWKGYVVSNLNSGRKTSAFTVGGFLSYIGTGEALVDTRKNVTHFLTGEGSVIPPNNTPPDPFTKGANIFGLPPGSIADPNRMGVR